MKLTRTSLIRILQGLGFTYLSLSTWRLIFGVSRGVSEVVSSEYASVMSSETEFAGEPTGESAISDIMLAHDWILFSNSITYSQKQNHN